MTGLRFTSVWSREAWQGVARLREEHLGKVDRHKEAATTKSTIHSRSHLFIIDKHLRGKDDIASLSVNHRVVRSNYSIPSRTVHACI